jgi:hypothetical protein
MEDLLKRAGRSLPNYLKGTPEAPGEEPKAEE